jgi:hypothetical protein
MPETAACQAHKFLPGVPIFLSVDVLLRGS